MGLLIRLWICMAVAVFTLYRYIDRLNELTELKLFIPALAKEVKEIQERNVELGYEIEQLKDPAYLMELSRKPELGHLKPVELDALILIPYKNDEPHF